MPFVQLVQDKLRVVVVLAYKRRNEGEMAFTFPHSFFLNLYIKNIQIFMAKEVYVSKRTRSFINREDARQFGLGNIQNAIMQRGYVLRKSYADNESMSVRARNRARINRAERNMLRQLKR